MNVYIGRKRQRGHGIGGAIASGLSSILGEAVPIVSSLAQGLLGDLGGQAVKSGIGMIGDVLTGHNVGESLKRRGQEFGRGIGLLPPQPSVQQRSITNQPYPFQHPMVPNSYAAPPPAKRRRVAANKRSKTTGSKVSKARGSKKSRRSRDIFD